MTPSLRAVALEQAVILAKQAMVGGQDMQDAQIVALAEVFYVFLSEADL